MEQAIEKALWLTKDGLWQVVAPGYFVVAFITKGGLVVRSAPILGKHIGSIEKGEVSSRWKVTFVGD